MATGEADIVPSIAVQDATNPATDFAYPNSETFFMRIDVQVPPLDDKRIREALNLPPDEQAEALAPIARRLRAHVPRRSPAACRAGSERSHGPSTCDRSEALRALRSASGTG